MINGSVLAEPLLKEIYKAALEAGLSLGQTMSLTGPGRAGLHRRLGQTAISQGELDAAHRWFDAALLTVGDDASSEAQTEAVRALIGRAWHITVSRFIMLWNSP